MRNPKSNYTEYLYTTPGNAVEVLIGLTFTVDHDPGVHTFSNGDPGYPPSTSIDIYGVEVLEVTMMDGKRDFRNVRGGTVQEKKRNMWLRFIDHKVQHDYKLRDRLEQACFDAWDSDRRDGFYED